MLEDRVLQFQQCEACICVEEFLFALLGDIFLEYCCRLGVVAIQTVEDLIDMRGPLFTLVEALRHFAGYLDDRGRRGDMQMYQMSQAPSSEMNFAARVCMIFFEWQVVARMPRPSGYNGDFCSRSCSGARHNHRPQVLLGICQGTSFITSRYLVYHIMRY